MENNNNEINEILKNYTNNLMNSRPDFLKMIYDSYSEFDFDELETAITASLSEKNILNLSLSNKSEKKSSHKGFYTNFEQFLKGYENEKWLNLMAKVLKNVKLNNNQQSKDKPPEIRQLEFLKPEEIPKRPEWKFASNIKEANQVQNSLATGPNLPSMATFQPGLNFNFKSKDLKIISFASTSNLRPEKLNNYIKDVYMSRGGDHVIKLVDSHKDNKIIFIEKIDTDETDTGEPVIDGVIDLKSLEKRAEVLVTSRLMFIEKVATTVCKFIISMKKLYKNKKEKEKQKALHGVNSVRSLNGAQKEGYSNLVGGLAQSASGNNIIKEMNEKLKRIREIISSRSMKTILSNSNSTTNKSGGKESSIDLKKFKKILNKKVENKEKMKKFQKLNFIKEKVKKAIELEELVNDSEDHDRYMEESNYYDETIEDQDSSNDYIRKKSIHDTEGKNKSSLILQSEDAFETPVKQSQYLKKRKMMNTQILDMVKDLAEEKVVMPKKKLDCNGLKMFIKQDLLNKISKK